MKSGNHRNDRLGQGNPASSDYVFALPARQTRSNLVNERLQVDLSKATVVQGEPQVASLEGSKLGEEDGEDILKVNVFASNEEGLHLLKVGN